MQSKGGLYNGTMNPNQSSEHILPINEMYW